MVMRWTARCDPTSREAPKHHEYSSLSGIAPSGVTARCDSQSRRTGGGGAAFVVNSRQDILAVNHLGRAFCAPMFESRTPANMARFTYLDPRAQDFFAEWNRTAKECVAALRTQVGRDPSDRDLSDLVGELSTRCEEIAAL
jgi:MmyB-like transcription regulator ligand binding domain